MSYPVSTFIGLRYAKASKSSHFIAFINLFSVVGIALGLIALITVSSVMNGFELQLKTRMLGITPHIVADTRELPPQQIEAIGEIKGVQAISGIIESEAIVQSRRGIQGVLLHGVDPEFMQQHSIVSENMMIGQFNKLQAGQYNIIIGRALASKLNIRPGEQIRLISAGASSFSPMGRMPSQRLFNVVGLFDLASQLDDKVVYVNIADNAKLLRKSEDKLRQTRLFLDDAFEYQQIVKQIQVPTVDWRFRQGPLFDAVKMEKNMMSLMLLLIIAVAAFNIVSALVMIVTEKQGDIAILRTQGMRGSSIISIFLINGLYNGIKGTFFGLVLGLILVSQLNTILNFLGLPIAVGDGQGLPIDIQWQQIIFLVVLSIGLCFIATLYPAYRALKVRPAEALKYE
ncbi:lipoprotein-releasing ABC transporter permease subunit [Aliiglaciecola lipolytica]|uniref:Lipoprotein-releasing system transmembrane protein lolC n=1 Tax=Aliiglaciecola lipolytica E3 TaxID=1127673 RepID=K6YC04_9ALTE|nr:lipoprotein-releasing ABC transporter permease subunit [Aliiglaciecola lipolytica]GAC14178.1 lipoprotein-releasing system transmembrane protein lolC [Aliiglaciecola lipolytica E3]